MLARRCTDLGLIGAFLVGAEAPGQSSPAERCSPGSRPVARWELPATLAEVSGLSLGPGGRLLAHGDEAGRLVELDQASGKVLRRITLKGEPKGDFEGVAASGDTVIMMTSMGRLYRFTLAGAGDSRDFTTEETGLGRSCELEGLAWDTGNQQLLLPCKNGRTPATRAGLTIFRWSLDGKPHPAPVRIAAEPLARAAGVGRINPTAIEVDPVTGNLLLLSSRPAVLLTIDRRGRILRVTRLGGKSHPRAEGLAVSRDAIYIGDEGVGGRGTIAKYACGTAR